MLFVMFQKNSVQYWSKSNWNCVGVLCVVGRPVGGGALIWLFPPYICQGTIFQCAYTLPHSQLSSTSTTILPILLDREANYYENSVRRTALVIKYHNLFCPDMT